MARNNRGLACRCLYRPEQARPGSRVSLGFFWPGITHKLPFYADP